MIRLHFSLPVITKAADTQEPSCAFDFFGERSGGRLIGRVDIRGTRICRSLTILPDLWCEIQLAAGPRAGRQSNLDSLRRHRVIEEEPNCPEGTRAGWLDRGLQEVPNLQDRGQTGRAVRST